MTIDFNPEITSVLYWNTGPYLEEYDLTRVLDGFESLVRRIPFELVFVELSASLDAGLKEDLIARLKSRPINLDLCDATDHYCQSVIRKKLQFKEIHQLISIGSIPPIGTLEVKNVVRFNHDRFHRIVEEPEGWFYD